MILFLTALLNAQASQAVREPAVAGMFYPEKPKILSQMIDKYLAETEILIDQEIGGLVSPHAGYVYSGQVAAWSFRQIKGKKYDVVVVIAPSHFEPFSGMSVYSGSYYETPLGKIPIDREIAKLICEKSDNIHLSEDGHHFTYRGRGEHSLEVQLPFLQKVLTDFSLIPIVIANQTWKNAQDLGNVLAEVLKAKKALIVASTDLSHYHSYSNAYEMDKSFLALFEDFKIREIIGNCQSRQVEACGFGPVAAMMQACSSLGFKKSKILKYATSGDIPNGEKAQVVGYMSGVVYR